MPRTWTLTTRILAGAAIAAAIAWMVLTVANFVTGSGIDTRVYSDAGQFFSFAYGLPLGIAGAALGAAATVIAGQVANKQGDIQLLQMAIEQTERSIGLFKSLTRSIGYMLRTGNTARRLGDQLLSQLQAERGPAISPTVGILEKLDDALPDDERISQVLAEIDDHELRVLIAAVAENLLTFRDVVAGFSDVFDRMTDSIFVAHFARIQIEDAEADDERPLQFLRRVLPKTVVENSNFFSDSIHDIAVNIRSVAEDVRPVDLAIAAIHLPDDNYTIDFIGYVFLPLRLRLKRMIPYGHRHIGGYCINLGAAYLLTAAQYIPDRDTLVGQFERMFDKRSKAVVTFLRDTFPGRYDFGPRFILESLDYCLHAPNRLILVEVHDGGSFIQEFYDPDRHGAIPSGPFDGYDLNEDPDTVSV